MEKVHLKIMNYPNFQHVKMNVVETASNGAVNEQTIFHFNQRGDVVTAKYAGGGIRSGFLAGRVAGDSLRFKYAQQHQDSNVYGGFSDCEVVLESGSFYELVEHFHWDSGSGKNVFRRLETYYEQQEVDEVVRQFEDCSLPIDRWDHHAHLLVGFWYAMRHDFDEALKKMRAGVIKYNEAHGTPNSETSGYHETITRFWLHVIFEYCKLLDSPDGWNSFLNASYASKTYIFNFYSRELLFSKKARNSWHEPDLKLSSFL